MNLLCFGAFANIIKKATGQNNEDTVYMLLGSITKPLSLKNRNRDEFIFDKNDISKYMNSTKNVPSTIKNSAPRAKNTIISYFEMNIVSKIQEEDHVVLLDSVRQLVLSDTTIDSGNRDNLLKFADIKTLSPFLGAVFIYAMKRDNTFNNIKKPKSDNTSQSAVPQISNTETYLLAEVDMICPFCGDSLMKTKGTKAIPEYQVTYIYLHNPMPLQDAVLKAIPLPPHNLDDIKNKIALCLTCNNSYLKAFSADAYYELLELKRKAAELYQARLSIDKVKIESDLTEIVKALAANSLSDLGKTLNMEPLKIDKKIPASNSLLKSKIKYNIVSYFNFIRELFAQESENGSFDYNFLAQDIKSAYCRLASRGITHNNIFEELVKWVQKSSRVKNMIACEIIVSYFVQSCEVFNEIS